MTFRYEAIKINPKITKFEIEEKEQNTENGYWVYGIGSGLGLTPRIKAFNSMYAFTIHIYKQIKDNANDSIIAELRMDFKYALDIPDHFTPTAEEIFELMEEANSSFWIEWKYYVAKTRFEKQDKVEKFIFDDQLADIERTIDFWEDSMRNLKLDENQKPTDE